MKVDEDVQEMVEFQVTKIRRILIDYTLRDNTLMNLAELKEVIQSVGLQYPPSGAVKKDLRAIRTEILKLLDKVDLLLSP